MAADHEMLKPPERSGKDAASPAADPALLRAEEKHLSSIRERSGFETGTEAWNRIEPSPNTNWRLPWFLHSTATEEERCEIQEIMQELQRLNVEYVGRSELEVQVYLAVSGEEQVLLDRMRAWCLSYFGRRVRKRNAKDKGSPGRTFDRLLSEYSTICGYGEDEDLPNTVDAMFASRCLQYVAVLLWENTWKDCFMLTEDGRLVPDLSRIDFSFLGYASHIERYNLYTDFLREFLDRFRRRGDQKRIREISRQSEQELRQQLEGLAYDIQEMRPFLLKNFRPEKTSIVVSGDLAFACNWALRDAMLYLPVADTLDSLRIGLARMGTTLPVAVRYDGLLVDEYKPWITAVEIDDREGISSLALNLYVLELMHERLFSFYDQIDFGRLRRAQTHATKEGELADDMLALSCQDLAETDSDSRTTSESEPAHMRVGRYLRPLRLRRLLHVLERKLCCQVRDGKGSEVVVYRPGGKIFVLSRHKRDYSVPALIVKELLRRVGIGPDEWIRAVYK